MENPIQHYMVLANKASLLKYPYSYWFIFFFFFFFFSFFFYLQRIEQERYRDQLRRLNIDLGRHNSTDFEEEGERYKNGTTEPLLGAKNGTEVVNAL